MEISCSAWNNLASSGEELAPFSSQDGTWCRNFHRNEATKAQKLKMKPQKLRMLFLTLRLNKSHMFEKKLFWFPWKWSYKNSIRIRSTYNKRSITRGCSCQHLHFTKMIRKNIAKMLQKILIALITLLSFAFKVSLWSSKTC